MKYGRRGGAGFAKGDMTPMIDMTFQLIAFFMVLINFAEADQNERINLPSSELAKPPEGPIEEPITLHVTDEETVIYGPREVPIEGEGLFTLLLRERQMLEARGKSASNATVIIRADRNAKTGVVQRVIEACQKREIGFEKFALRAKHEM
jgi:biopolymer transport protein ExbD